MGADDPLTQSGLPQKHMSIISHGAYHLAAISGTTILASCQELSTVKPV